MKINNLVLLLLSFGMIYLLLFKKEKMSNTDIKKIVSQVYQADIESIRNLSKLANDLTNTGKLTVPGGLEILGEVTMKKGLKITGTIAGQGSNTLELVGGLSVKNGTVSINRSDNYQALDVNGISKFNKMVNMTNAELRIKNGKNGTTHFNYKNRGTNYIRGSALNIDTITNNMSKGLTIRENLHTLGTITGNGTVTAKYIRGKRGQFGKHGYLLVGEHRGRGFITARSWGCWYHSTDASMRKLTPHKSKHNCSFVNHFTV